MLLLIQDPLKLAERQTDRSQHGEQISLGQEHMKNPPNSKVCSCRTRKSQDRHECSIAQKGEPLRLCDGDAQTPPTRRWGA